jgi:p-aminobenzoyl-glutamate transporter AbgT
MKSVRVLAAVLIFVVSCPISWVCGWYAGGWATAGMSVLLPTYGCFYWLISRFTGPGMLCAIASVVLGFGGAFVSLTSIHALLSGEARR